MFASAKIAPYDPHVKHRKVAAMITAATRPSELRTVGTMSALQATEIGERIAQARLRAGMTQEQLADLIGKSTRSMQDYEAGKTIPWKDLRQIALLTEVPVDWLIHGSHEEESLKRMLLDVLDRLERIEDELGTTGSGREPSSEEGEVHNAVQVHERSDAR